MIELTNTTERFALSVRKVTFESCTKPQGHQSAKAPSVKRHDETQLRVHMTSLVAPAQTLQDYLT